VISGEGRLIIALQGAIRELDFRDDAERDEYLSDLAESFGERLRQNLLTWRNNRLTKPAQKS